MSEEEMNVPAVIERLQEAVALQFRSALQYTLVAASVAGFEYHALGTELWSFAEAELADARRLIEKMVALGGHPGTEVAPLGNPREPAAAVDLLIDTECEALRVLHAVIPDTGQEPRSEAVEHLIEHLMLRKQQQVDTLLRARGPKETG
jgi:bacterioferritin (cytochrome b1)